MQTKSIQAGERTHDFRDTPVGRVLEQARRDCDLIRADVERREWKSSIHGIETQIENFTRLRDDMKSATKGL